jgi:hypothetical protein
MMQKDPGIFLHAISTHWAFCGGTRPVFTAKPLIGLKTPLHPKLHTRVRRYAGASGLFARSIFRLRRKMPGVARRAEPGYTFKPTAISGILFDSKTT